MTKKKISIEGTIENPQAATPTPKTRKPSKQHPVLQALEDIDPATLPAAAKPKAKKGFIPFKKKASSEASAYKYPATCTDAISRKKFRATARKKLKALQTKLEKASPKEKKAIQAEITAFKAEVYNS